MNRKSKVIRIADWSRRDGDLLSKQPMLLPGLS